MVGKWYRNQRETWHKEDCVLCVPCPFCRRKGGSMVASKPSSMRITYSSDLSGGSKRLKSSFSQELKTPITAYGAVGLQISDSHLLPSQPSQCLGCRKGFRQSLVFLVGWKINAYNTPPSKYGYCWVPPQGQHPNCHFQEQLLFLCCAGKDSSISVFHWAGHCRQEQ